MLDNLGSFCLIKNEGFFIKKHLESWLPILGQMVFWDGNSTDGTLETIKDFRDNHPFGYKIKLREDKDIKDLTKDYQKLSNECQWDVDKDLAIFLHPDMFFEKVVGEFPHKAVAASVNIRSFAGNPGGPICEIKGRSDKWKNIYRLRNPNLGAHYFGNYGAWNEDTYFSEITGNEHIHYGHDFSKYPYPVPDSGIHLLHYSDLRPYSRRLDRMIKCLINQGHSEAKAKELAPKHPRVSLETGAGFAFEMVDDRRFN